jgi:hypothetical protein
VEGDDARRKKRKRKRVMKKTKAAAGAGAGGGTSKSNKEKRSKIDYETLLLEHVSPDSSDAKEMYWCPIHVYSRARAAFQEREEREGRKVVAAVVAWLVSTIVVEGSGGGGGGGSSSLMTESVAGGETSVGGEKFSLQWEDMSLEKQWEYRLVSDKKLKILRKKRYEKMEEKKRIETKEKFEKKKILMAKKEKLMKKMNQEIKRKKAKEKKRLESWLKRKEAGLIPPTLEELVPWEAPATSMSFFRVGDVLERQWPAGADEEKEWRRCVVTKVTLVSNNNGNSMLASPAGVHGPCCNTCSGGPLATPDSSAPPH